MCLRTDPSTVRDVEHTAMLSGAIAIGHACVLERVTEVPRVGGKRANPIDAERAEPRRTAIGIDEAIACWEANVRIAALRGRPTQADDVVGAIGVGRALIIGARKAVAKGRGRLWRVQTPPARTGGTVRIFVTRPAPRFRGETRTGARAGATCRRTRKGARTVSWSSILGAVRAIRGVDRRLDVGQGVADRAIENSVCGPIGR